MAMRAKTQNLPNSFSSDNKKQKVVCPKLRLGKRFGESDLGGVKLTNWQWQSNHEPITGFGRNGAL